MKTITINGRTFQYKIINIDNEFDSGDRTEFYDGTETYTTKKYVFFGDTQIHIKPKKVFTLYFNIEDVFYTKKQVREKLEHQVELLDRADEIARGEII